MPLCMNNFAAVSKARRTRLKQLVARLEQLPVSAERDRMLSEVRSRAVDLDTGVAPRAMLRVDAPILGPRRPPPERLTATARSRVTRRPGTGGGGLTRHR
jgi:hypothetical protein